MKKFICKTISFGLIVSLLLILPLLARIALMKNLSWKIPSEKHILFLGASQPQRAIDDTMCKSIFNFSTASERYMYTYIKIVKLLPENPQIDTIFLQCAPTDLWKDTDDKYFNKNEQQGFLPLFWPFFEKEHWHILKNENIYEMIMILLSKPKLHQIFHPSLTELGHFASLDAEMDREKVKYNLIQGEGNGHTINYMYLRKIIDLCKSKDIKLYLMYYPMYHAEYYYDLKYFYQAYHNYFSDVELLDYSDFPIEDDCRYDTHHLNEKGAKIFTQELIDRFGFQ